MRLVRRCSALVAVVWLLGFGLRGVVPAAEPPRFRAPVHPGPPVYIEIEIERDAVDVVVTGEQRTLLTWLRRPDTVVDDLEYDPEPLDAPLTPSSRAELTEQLGHLFGLDGAPLRAFDSADVAGRSRVRLLIDGEPVEWTVRDIHVPADEEVRYGVPALRFTLHCPRPRLARSLEVTWLEWRRLNYFERTRLPILFRAFGDADLRFLEPVEPGYVWRADSMVPPEPPVLATVAEPKPPMWRLPLFSIGALLVLLVGVPLAVRGRVARGPLVVLVVGCLSGAWFGRSVFVHEIDDPFAGPVVVPDAEAAAELFDGLHRNIYRAFDARGEDRIYSLLAASVTPNLLDELYGEVMESLVMRGEGGAVCQIESYAALETELDLQPELQPWDEIPEALAAQPRFDVGLQWEVQGVVSHWGHEHRRVNRYDARFSVVHDGQAWRIADIDIEDHERVELKPEETLLTESPDGGSGAERR